MMALSVASDIFYRLSCMSFDSGGRAPVPGGGMSGGSIARNRLTGINGRAGSVRHGSGFHACLVVQREFVDNIGAGLVVTDDLNLPAFAP